MQSYFDTLLRYGLSVTFCGAVVLKVMDQKTLVNRRGGYKVRLTVSIYKHLESLPDTSSQIFDLLGNLAKHSFSLFDRNKTQP